MARAEPPSELAIVGKRRDVTAMSGSLNFMTKTFQHTFKDGQKIDLGWDLSGDIPKCKCSLRMENQPDEIRDEYRTWVEKVVVPIVFNELTPKQLRWFAINGFSAVRKEIEAAGGFSEFGAD